MRTNNLTRIQTWVAGSLIPIAIGVVAAGIIVVRPFEKKAVAHSAEFSQKETQVERTLPKIERWEEIVIVVKKPTHQPLAHIPATPDRECWQMTPGSSCLVQDLVQGTAHSSVRVCTCP